ncbi:hypothetical protein V6C27_09200 [Peptococcaceae bacterium 1198_IL3148]
MRAPPTMLAASSCMETETWEYMSFVILVELCPNIEQDEFKSAGAKYVRLYSFILQIGPFADVDLHKLYIYLTFLLKKLPRSISETVNLADDVALEYYRNQKTFDGSISLVKEDATELKKPGDGGGTAKDLEKAPLSSIIEKLNDRFGTDFSPADQLSVEQLKEDFFQDEELARKAKTNTLDNFKYSYYKKFMDKTVDRMSQNQKFFVRILDDEKFRETLMDLMLVETYEHLRAGDIGGQTHY